MAKDVKPERAVVEVIDEEQEGAGMFEPAGALEVLEQIGDCLLYTSDRLWKEHPYKQKGYTNFKKK